MDCNCVYLKLSKKLQIHNMIGPKIFGFSCIMLRIWNFRDTESDSGVNHPFLVIWTYSFSTLTLVSSVVSIRYKNSLLFSLRIKKCLQPPFEFSSISLIIIYLLHFIDMTLETYLLNKQTNKSNLYNVGYLFLVPIFCTKTKFNFCPFILNIN